MFHLDEIGFINLKKQCGGANANINKVWEYYQTSKAIIALQIAYLNPDIIINCSRISDFFDYLVRGNPKYTEGFAEYCFVDSKLVINTYHPNARVGEKEYVNAVLSIVKKYQQKLRIEL